MKPPTNFGGVRRTACASHLFKAKHAKKETQLRRGGGLCDKLCLLGSSSSHGSKICRGEPCQKFCDIFQVDVSFSSRECNASGRTDFTWETLSPNLQARFCKLYPADVVDWNWFGVIQVNSWFPKNRIQGSLYLKTMPRGFFLMVWSVKSPRTWRCHKRTRPCLKKSSGGGLN